MHSVTDRRTDRLTVTDDIIMPIADHTECNIPSAKYEKNKTIRTVIFSINRIRTRIVSSEYESGK